MNVSEARIAANRRNAERSTGPRTEEGKARSRANALKHGMAGEGIVLPDDMAAEVEVRFEAFEADLQPRNDVARFLVRRAAMLSIRLERCVEQETANLSNRVRHAVEKFDDERLAEMEKAYDWIASEPLTNARRLRQSPEGIDRLLDNFQSLRDRLTDPLGALWDWTSTDRFHLLIGRRILDVPTTRARALGDAIGGNFQLLNPEDAAGLEGMDRQAWAVQRMIELIDVEMEALKTLRESLNPEAIEADRAEAPSRAKFDPSPEATLARKYEAAAERGFFRTLKEFREVNSAALGPPPVIASRFEEPTCAPVGSSQQDESDATQPEPPLLVATSEIPTTDLASTALSSPLPSVPHLPVINGSKGRSKKGRRVSHRAS